MWVRLGRILACVFISAIGFYWGGLPVGMARWGIPVLIAGVYWGRYHEGYPLKPLGAIGFSILWSVCVGLTGLLLPSAYYLTTDLLRSTGGALGYFTYRVLYAAFGAPGVVGFVLSGLGTVSIVGLFHYRHPIGQLARRLFLHRPDAPDPVKKQAAKSINQSVKKSTKQGAKPTKGQDYPGIALLDTPVAATASVPLDNKGDSLVSVLASFGVSVTVENITVGPSVTRYEVSLGKGIKLSKLVGLSHDIALKLAMTSVRIEAIPGQALVGIEIPNAVVQPVFLRSLLQSKAFQASDKLLAGMGLSITGDPIIMNLASMPHVLIAGATGSGKSVCVNTIILSILMRASPSEVKFVMIDPKKVELNLYDGIPHLLAPVVTDSGKAAATLQQWVLKEMERRYTIFSKLGVKHLAGYNEKISQLQSDYKKKPAAVKQLLSEKLGYDPAVETPVLPAALPYIVVIIDELADLMMVAAQDVETTICRLAQMARATGIHLVIATQRPSVNVITGLIKANIPSRISFFLQSQIDSRTILDASGAEKLLGKGDMLYMPVGTFKPQRAQGVYVSEGEVERVVAFWKSKGSPDYQDDILNVELDNKKGDKADAEGEDSLFGEAKQLVQSQKKVSVSFLQRKLKIGYNRASRLMDELEEKQIVTAYDEAQKSRLVIR